MKCPHCVVEFHDKESRHFIGNDPDGFWGVGVMHCASCGRLIVRLFSAGEYYANTRAWGQDLASYLVRPKVAGRTPIPAEVPSEYQDDFNEACLVLADSAKASAALSRRCLQNLLRSHAKVKHRDLAKEIEEVLARGVLPSHISDGLDAVRVIGNFAAHPMKSQSTGEIVPVELGEAEWNLDVLESLFDFYFVAPARLQAKRDALNKKLADAGKKPVK
jgi:Domain of unknown function (DUF4145)